MIGGKFAPPRQSYKCVETIEILINNFAIIGSIGRMAAYSNNEYYDMLLTLGECHGDVAAAARRYAELYPNRARHPSYHVILAAAQRLRETGSVLPKKQDTGRHRHVRNVENVETILRTAEEEPETSIRVIARQHGLSYSTVQRTLSEEKLHAYHYTRAQELREDDYRSRRTFCENFLTRAQEDPAFPSRVIFSDESLFTREGIFNTHNMHMWSDENPRATRIRNFQTRWKKNVWAGIMGTKILGPVILPETLSGASYLDFLEYNMPEFLEDVPLSERSKILFQQDGAGPHNARVITDYLNQHFPGRWMGRYGPIRWPARSPDLNPLDFFLWGHCKEKVYKKIPENEEELNMKLHEAIWDITDDIMQKIPGNLLRRMRACIVMNGGHFEHLL